MEHQSLKALQQRIVQISGDACPLADARFQPMLNCSRHLMEAKPIQAPEQCQKSGHARRTEPGGLVVRRGDGEIQGRAGLVPHAAVIAGDHAEAVVAREEDWS